MRNCLFVFIFLLISAAGYSQCTLSVSISASNPKICSGNKVLLTATTSGGSGALTFAWTTGESTSSINVNKEGTYTVTVTDKTPGCSGVSSSINISIGTSPDAPNVTGKTIVCPGTSATLTANGSSGVYQWYDAPEGGNFLSGNATFVTPPINGGGVIYYVQASQDGCPSLRTGVFCDATKGPTVQDMTLCAGTSTVLTASGGSDYQWYDSQSGGNLVGTGASFNTPILTSSATYYVVATVNGCVSSRTAVQAIVTPAPVTPSASGVSICSGSKASLHATPGPGIYKWYDSPGGGTPLILSPDYTTPPLTATTTYYVQNSINGCESGLTAVTVTVNEIPPPPGDQVQNTCTGSSVLLTASASPPASGTYEWYTVEVDGTPVHTGLTYQTPVLNANATYYVLLNNGGCSGARSKISVVVNPPPAPPSVSGTIICNGSATTLTATGPGGVYNWYDVPTGGTSLHTGDTFTTPVLTATTQYYVETTLSGCTSARKTVTVSVNSAIPPPTAADASTCSGSSASLVASGSSGTYEWYDSATGGTLLGSGQAYSTPAITATTIYYVQTTVNGCASPRKAVTVTINPVPSAPTVSGTTTVCSGSTATLTANAPGGTLEWFDAASGGNQVKTGSTFTTPALTVNTTYYVQNTVGSCTSARTPVTITVGTETKPQFQYPTGSVCNLSPDVTPTINNPGGGTFTSTPAGLVIDPSTGKIDVSASTPNITYSITFTGNGTCATPSTATFKIFTVGNAAFTYKPVYCQDEANPTPDYGGVGSGGVFSATPTGLVFVNTSTGEIDLKKSTPNAYTIKNDVSGVGGCAGDIKTQVVTIDQAVTISAGPDQTVTAGTPVQLAGSVSGVPKGTWTGGAGSFSNNTIPNPVYTPGTGETSATLTYKSDDPSGSCIAKSDQVTITFKNTPAKPTVTGTTTCAGSSANLSAIAPGGTYKWYDAATAGNLLAKTSSYTTPALTASQSYFVQQTINGCTSPMTQVDVVVSPLPVVTSLATGSVCSGTPLNYTITSNVTTATFSWDRPAVTGISNPAVTGQTGNTITEILINTTATSVNVDYLVTPMNNGCPGATFKYTVTVYPTPAVTSGNKVTICNKAPVNYDITFNTAANFEWSRAAVPGVSNTAISGQNTATIRETLINTTNTPVDVTYVIASSTSTCLGAPFNVTVTVNPSVRVTSSETGTACSSVPQSYVITSNIASATYTWSREESAGITNPAVSGQTASTITETLINTLPVATHVVYKILASANGCPSDSTFFYVVIVNPQPTKPAANANSPICVGSTLQLRTPDVANGAFLWTGPNGYSSTQQNPDILNATQANVGDYSLVVTVNGCSSEVSTVSVIVRTPGIADAGPDQIVCITDPDIVLAGKVTGGTGQGIWASTSASPGVFTSLTDLNAHYSPSKDERDIGKVTFVLTTTSDDDCAISTDTVVVNFGPLPAVNAGPDQGVCSQTPAVQLHGFPLLGGTKGEWTSMGTGNFSSTTDYNANYFPSAADVLNGSVDLVMHVVKNGPCQIETDTVKITFIPPPLVTAEKIRYVLKDRTLTLHPSVSDNNVTYLWTPNINIEDNTIKNPVITGVNDITYTLTVTDSRGCVSTDSTIVKVSPKVVIPNTFTPNSDGINDVWNIQGLVAYTDAVVDIFTRYGQKVYHSIGYDRPWDGFFNGKQLPTGVYYYVIDTRLYKQILSGSITLLR